MRTQFLVGSLAFGLVTTGTAINAQTSPTSPDGSQTMPDPSNPMPPMDEPLPPEMPIRTEAGANQMPVVIDRSLPPGPPATSPSIGADTAVSGSTSDAMMAPVAATKTYPLCSKTLQDNCINPGEAPKTAKKRR